MKKKRRNRLTAEKAEKAEEAERTWGEKKGRNGLAAAFDEFRPGRGQRRLCLQRREAEVDSAWVWGYRGDGCGLGSGRVQAGTLAGRAMEG